MAEKRKRSKYQLKLRTRTALANRVGGAFHSQNKDGKRLPFAMAILQKMKINNEEFEEEAQIKKSEEEKNYKFLKDQEGWED